jgi:pimeloyl-ACP methyl ester carboxylesterase
MSDRGQRSEAKCDPREKLDPREEHFRIAAPSGGLALFLRYLAPASSSPPATVLYVHGATFPSALSIAHRFDDGRSWRDALSEAGFHVWGLDFLGFGGSDRYPEMAEPAEAHPPLCRADDAATQLEAAVRFILAQQKAQRLSIIAHSWGTIVACRFAGLNPTLAGRLVLFGPIAWRQPTASPAPTSPAWRIVTLEDQWRRFIEDVPKDEPPVLSRSHFDTWGEAYLDSDHESRSRHPAGVKIPAGPFADIVRAWHGTLAYNPAAVKSPVAIVRGAWDGLATDEDARRLFDGFTSAPAKQDIKIGRGTHLMHLEAMRHALHRASIAFLLGD